MAHNPAAMKAVAAFAVANCLGRYQDLKGRDINTDQRFGYQCMDLWNWLRFYVLGFLDILPTPDAASVWELNNQPELGLWSFFDAILPDRPGMPGDIGIMNRQFFNNGVGHIFIVLRDLGQQLEVLELNGLGDGFEDDAGGQHGSPARTHIWPKTHLYGYLRWIGPAPQTGMLAPAGDTTHATNNTPEEAGLSGEDVKEVNAYTGAMTYYGFKSEGKQLPGLWPVMAETQRRQAVNHAAVIGELAALRQIVVQAVKGQGINQAELEAAIDGAVQKALEANVVKVAVSVEGVPVEAPAQGGAA